MAITEGQLQVGGTDKSLDTTVVTNSRNNEVHREAVFLADPETLAARAAVLNKSPVPGDYGLVVRPLLPLDAFGRLRVSNPVATFDSQMQYDELDLVWNEKLTGSGTFTHDANGSFGDMDTTTASGDEVIRQSPYQRYQPGKSQLILVTFDMVEQLANCRKRVGYFDANNGIFLELDGSTVSFVLRSKVTGSVVDTKVAQASWSHDVHDGTGPSGATLDITKSQILFIDIEWLGVGIVRCGFIHNGYFHVAHVFTHANTANKTYMTTANLPVRYEITNTAATASAGKLRQVCCSVISEGGFEDAFGFDFAQGNGATPISVTTRRAVMSIRPKATFNSIANRAIIIPKEFGVFAQTNPAFIELVYNGTLGGTPSWTSANASSVVEFDVAGTTVTGGITIAHSHADAGGSGNNAFAGRAQSDLAARYPLHLDIDGANPTILSLVVTSMSGTCSAAGHIGWKELR